MDNNFKVVDFFCGAGGFSEGFRQLGFEILYGYDHWRPAVETYNYNYGLKCEITDILKFQNVDNINLIPNSEVILGSPPCVSFSSSNKSGGADKSLGVKLVETYLKIVAVKKFQPNSKLEAWFMENVVNSRKHLKDYYTFADLDLAEWAKENSIKPETVAINLSENTLVINAAEYGSFQARKRVISGEIIKIKKMVKPFVLHSIDGKDDKLRFNTISDFKKNFPKPNTPNLNLIFKDPQYGFEIAQNELTDHFYDTGVYKVEWENSKYWKTNHPYMGKMAFPENEHKPSRTITATKIANSREAILYKSEFNRLGDGEYRMPTIREAAIIMGFPISYQFLGKENTKWRLVGNAVCCSVSRALAKTVLEALKISTPSTLSLRREVILKDIINLNTFSEKKFENPPRKKSGSRFRRHLIKDGNLTVTLSNYDIKGNSKSFEGKWFTSIQYGTGKGFPIQRVCDGYYKELEEIINSLNGGKEFLKNIKTKLGDKIPNSVILQDLYERQVSKSKYLEPTELLNVVNESISKYGDFDQQIDKQNVFFEFKERVPARQLFALYAINKISTIANKKICQ
jgi:DNA (cytosine-5)-methyltransferase 1